MAPPTRVQIEANPVKPSYRVYVRNYNSNAFGYAWLQVADNAIIDIGGDIQTSGTKSNGIAFGDKIVPSATITMAADAQTIGGYVVDLKYINPREAQFRIQISYDGSDYITVFEGVLTGKNYDSYIVTFTCEGYVKLLEDTKIFGLAHYRRAIATKTTLSSQENPDGVGYIAGTVNEIFWRAGGRPWEQKDINYADTDDDFVFWYQCDYSIVTPDWSWLAGENLSDEVYLLARATLGQVYQMGNIVRYVNPLKLVDGSANYIIDTSKFVTATYTANAEQWAGRIRNTYTPREVQPIQEVYKSNTTYVLNPGDIITIEADLDLPVSAYYDTLVGYEMKAVYLDNYFTALPDVIEEDYTAQRVTWRVYNSGTRTFIIYEIVLKGRPIAASKEKSVTIGLEKPEKVLENNPYIQTYYAARKQAQTTFAFYSEPLPVISLDGMMFDSDRFIGEIIRFQYSDFGYVDDNMRIVGIGYNFRDCSMRLDLVRVGNLPKLSDMFIIGNSYSDSDERRTFY